MRKKGWHLEYWDTELKQWFIHEVKCKTCEKKFRPRHSKGVYCSTKCRDKDLYKISKTLMHPYFKFGSPTICVYCGSSAEETDHIFAVSHQTLEKVPKGRRTRFGPICHCCNRCNHILGNKYFTTFDDRCREADLTWHLKWYGTKNYYMNLEPISWLPYFDEKDDKFKPYLFDYFKPTLIMIRGIYQ